MYVQYLINNISNNNIIILLSCQLSQLPFPISDFRFPIDDLFLSANNQKTKKSKEVETQLNYYYFYIHKSLIIIRS